LLLPPIADTTRLRLVYHPLRLSRFLRIVHKPPVLEGPALIQAIGAL